MRDQDTFNFRGTQPKTVDFENVVGAAGIPEEAFFVLVVFVAGAKPIAYKSLLGFFVFVPVAGTSRVAFDEEIADFVGRDGVSIFVDDFGFVAGDYFPTGAGLGLAGAIGDDHLQSFRGAERIENFDAKALFEAVK